MPAPNGDEIAELLERADAVAARYDAAIRAHHTCADGGLCQPCAEWDERLLEIERGARQGANAMIYDDDERDDAELTGIAAFMVWTLACVGFGVLVGVVLLHGVA
jgi:hypothetical protein